ncbi:MAG: type III-B CRISPR module RAMP protein Cmr6 [Desulfitobacteriaceae bacterium]|nr:type III-B CRISPR module RAMP protein Cmr6 [Desulfitobacteriaceae bacterium]MDD4401602.1 type III-B CRISPR module RAMP protein Cmr6 [Desulfitobacteriaceae bacterium]
MRFHPADTCAAYEGLNKDDIDQLWYQVHYFQQISLERDGNKRLKPLSRELKLTNSARILMDRHLNQREAALLAGLQATHSLAVLEGKLTGKLLHGLGGAHVRETSLTLHPLYGLPYIPASSIKGVIRNWVIQAFFDGQEEKLKSEQDLDQKHKDIKTIWRDIFGSEESSGQIEFFDAFVDSGFSLQPDVLTIHFPKYYKGESMPGDNQNPNPVNFYVISCRSVQFIVGIRRDAKLNSGYSPGELLGLAIAWLQKALAELGIGSKSSAGYGYFSEFQDVTAKTLQEAKYLMHDPSPAEKVQINMGASHLRPVEKKTVIKEEPPIDLSPAQRLIFKIEHFTEKDLQFSKDKQVFDQVIELGSKGEKGPALALKAYWEKNGAWIAQSKKQKLKIAQINNLLEG